MKKSIYIYIYIYMCVQISAKEKAVSASVKNIVMEIERECGYVGPQLHPPFSVSGTLRSLCSSLLHMPPWALFITTRSPSSVLIYLYKYGGGESTGDSWSKLCFSSSSRPFYFSVSTYRGVSRVYSSHYLYCTSSVPSFSVLFLFYLLTTHGDIQVLSQKDVLIADLEEELQRVSMRSESSVHRRYICVCISICLCISLDLLIYLSLSLSLYIYIYIYICVCKDMKV